MVMPGDNIQMTGELICPVAIERACASLSAKAAAPSVLAWSPRSSSDQRKLNHTAGDGGAQPPISYISQNLDN